MLSLDDDYYSQNSWRNRRDAKQLKQKYETNEQDCLFNPKFKDPKICRERINAEIRESIESDWCDTTTVLKAQFIRCLEDWLAFSGVNGVFCLVEKTHVIIKQFMFTQKTRKE